ncbi:MAG: hypothetical protein PHQ02_05465 [Candidatus Riflebacteria bacterium]|jgi:hypothetical protein|nr:hypothetical protein [Candidatus Riflebacteria bacterium]
MKPAIPKVLLTTEIRDDFKKYYDQFHVDGSFVLYDPQNDKYIF